LTGVLDRFEELLNETGLKLRRYQRAVWSDVRGELFRGTRKIIIAMPTGSGKTFVEMLAAYWGLVNGSDVLVIEPTRFLCEQQFGKQWSRIFGESLVSFDYEGRCDSSAWSRRIVISTPQTAKKCVEALGLKQRFRVLVVDEVHHAYGDRRYAELLDALEPDYVFGFTALLPSKKRFREPPGLKGVALLTFSPDALAKLGDYEPPKAIADIYDATMDELERYVYDYLVRIPWDPVRGRYAGILLHTLVKYGRRAFCETLSRGKTKKVLTDTGDYQELARACMGGLSHKARAFAMVLDSYQPFIEDLKPVIAFTSRKATAGELLEVAESRGLGARLLTGEADRRERLRILEECRGGEVDVVVSTIVGEEGVDIPSTGLLVMLDIPRSELRFYQRLGRLARRRQGSKWPFKYIVFVLTPGTDEYGPYLLDVVLRLALEGVDISFLVVNIEELIRKKGVAAAVTKLIGEVSRHAGTPLVPYTTVVGVPALSPLQILESLVEGCAEEALGQVIGSLDPKLRSLDKLSILLASLLSYWFFSGELWRLVRKRLKARYSTRLVRMVEASIKSGAVGYVYDPDAVSDALAMAIAALCRSVERCYLWGIRELRFQCKDLTTLFALLYTLDDEGKVLEALEGRFKALMDETRREIESTLALDYDVEVRDLNSYNERNRTLSPLVYISLRDRGLAACIRVYYYMIDMGQLKGMGLWEKWQSMVRANLKAIGYLTVAKLAMKNSFVKI